MHGWGFNMRVLIKALLLILLTQTSVFAGMVDPTKPPASVLEYLPNVEAQADKPWQLTAIQHNGQGGFAVVNGQMVQVGESYNGFRLTSVKNQQALFVSKTGEKKTLSLGLTSYIVQPPSPARAKAKIKTKAKTARHAGKIKQ